MPVFLWVFLEVHWWFIMDFCALSVSHISPFITLDLNFQEGNYYSLEEQNTGNKYCPKIRAQCTVQWKCTPPVSVYTSQGELPTNFTHKSQFTCYWEHRFWRDWILVGLIKAIKLHCVVLLGPRTLWKQLHSSSDFMSPQQLSANRVNPTRCTNITFFM